MPVRIARLLYYRKMYYNGIFRYVYVYVIYVETKYFGHARYMRIQEKIKRCVFNRFSVSAFPF